MKALVTGSSGHLGEALVRTLKNQNHEVVSIDIKASPFTSDWRMCFAERAND